MAILNGRGHRVISSEEKLSLLEKFHGSSEQSASSFAREHGIGVSTFHGWLKAERKGEKLSSAKQSTIRLLPNTLSGSAASKSRSGIVKVLVRCGSFFEFSYHQERQ